MVRAAAGPDYVHGYSDRERVRLADQANILSELLHVDTAYPAGHVVLEAGAGVGAQTVTLATPPRVGSLEVYSTERTSPPSTRIVVPVM